MKTWQYVCLCMAILYQCIAFYGMGIERVKADYQSIYNRQASVINSQEVLIDSLLIESGRDSMYNTPQELDVEWKLMQQNELFRKENQHNG